MRALPLGLGLLALAGCPGPANNTDTSTGPAVTSTGDEPTGTGTTDACMGSGDCDSEGICVADYTPADTSPPVGGMRSPASCAAEDACIGELDLTRWCFDHRGCCDDLRCRPADGICEPAHLGQLTTSGDDSSSTGDSSSSTGSTGTTDASTSTGSTDTGSTDTGSTGSSSG